VHDRVLRQMRAQIRTRQYVMTVHAEEEMDSDNLSILDVEHGILTGEIIERQQDVDTAEFKYLISGRTLGGKGIVVVGKLSATHKLVVITVYRE